VSRKTKAEGVEGDKGVQIVRDKRGHELGLGKKDTSGEIRGLRVVYQGHLLGENYTKRGITRVNLHRMKRGGLIGSRKQKIGGGVICLGTAPYCGEWEKWLC